MRRYRYLLGCLAAIGTVAFLLWFHANWPSPLTRLLTPVSDSPWEQSKAVFWGYLAGALVMWALSDRRESRAGHCVVLILVPLLTAMAGWLLPEEWILWPLGLVVGAILYGLFLNRKVFGGELLWYTLAILLGIAYILFTVMPPAVGPFLDSSAAAVMATIPC
ncbi:MAG: hypothetical protein E7457_02475 [Ruminococcaceae bacterium]|nr:hypothetical protein [Oscillospiraceae bacterium]